MSEFRLWVHRKIARLDGTRERRFVALATALIFASLALGPQALRAVDDVVNAPDIRIDELGANPVSNPVRFKATTLNVQLARVDFLVAMPDGTTMMMPGHLSSTTDPSLWESPDFVGMPGKSYEVRAKGFSPSTGAAVESSRSVTFTIFDPNSGGTTAPPPPPPGAAPPPNTGVPKTVEIVQIFAFPGTEPKIEMRGRHDGFTADAAFYRIQSISGLAFLAEREAVRENDVWHGLYAVPGGSVYQVKLVAREGAVMHESAAREISVPAAETPPAAPPPTAPPPPPPPQLSLILPNAGAELMSPVMLAARVMNATATSVIFEVLDPAGVTRQVQAGPGSEGGWSAMFIGEAGQYRVGARASLLDSTVIPPADFRSFRILASEPPPPPVTEPIPPTEPAAPLVELFSPSVDAAPFNGAVPMTARVRNGLPERVVAVVIGPTGAETVVIASKTPTGDFWNAFFEGPDGEYRFSMRALVAGAEVFSPERRFAVKRQVAAIPPPPTAPAPTPAATTAPPPTPVTPSPAPLPPPQPSGAIVEPGTGDQASTDINVDARDDGGAQRSPIPETMATECRAAGIPPERCEDWLKAKFQSRECLDAGALTREACAALLQRLNIASNETRLFGLIGRAEIVQAREDARALAGGPIRRDELPASIAALLPPGEDPSALVRVVAVANPREGSSPAILFLDTDGDGLPDDAERRFGSDPAKADSDGDGFDDGVEVKNGYDPAGPGKLDTPARGVEKALIAGLALEEPRGAETLVDPGFTIEADDSGPSEDVIRLYGKAAPNSVVTIFVYSYLPIVVTTTTDENGNWTYDFGSKLAEGRHEAYVSVNDDTGKLVAASSPFAFFVREAQAVSEEDFLRADVNVEETPTTLSRWFVYGGIGLVALALILVIAIVRQTRKDPVSGSGGGL